MPRYEDKNCDTWAEYEYPGESNTASLCNGGWFDGKKWDVCPHRDRCRYETKQVAKSRPGRTSLPTIQGRSGSRMIASTPTFARKGTDSRYIEPSRPPSPTVVSKPKTVGLDSSNPYIQTPRAPHQLGPSPTFLPSSKKEGVFKRLGKNVTQGWIAALGWHIFDMAQQIDMFPEDQEEPTPQHEDHPT